MTSTTSSFFNKEASMQDGFVSSMQDAGARCASLASAAVQSVDFGVDHTNDHVPA